MAQKRNSINHEKILYEGARKSFSLEKDEQHFIFKNEQAKGINATGPRFGKRHVETLFYFFAVLFSYLIRINLSITIVAMTDPNANSNKDIPTFDWTNRNIILSSFFWGYITPQVMAGWLMSRYGPKWFLVGTIALGCFVGYLIPPLAVYAGSTAVIVCRVIQGFCQGFLVPSIPTFLSRWAPLNERGRISTFIYAASSLGTVFGMMAGGSISASIYGWPMVFHIFSTFGIIWCILYAIFGRNSPSESTSITSEERAYIEKTSIAVGKKMMKVPWTELLKSGPLLAYFVTYTCNVFGFWVLLSQISIYMNKILLFDLKSNGLLSALPYVLHWAMGLVSSIISDFLTNRKILLRTTSRKIFTAIGMICPSISLILLGQCSKEHITLGVIALVLGVGTNGAILCGAFMNNVDLSPNFGGVIQGFVNGFSNIFAVLAPIVVEIIVTEEKNPARWRELFYLTSAVYTFGAIVFFFFGSGEVQPWNENNKNDEKGEDGLQ